MSSSTTYLPVQSNFRPIWFNQMISTSPSQDYLSFKVWCRVKLACKTFSLPILDSFFLFLSIVTGIYLQCSSLQPLPSLTVQGSFWSLSQFWKSSTSSMIFNLISAYFPPDYISETLLRNCMSKCYDNSILFSFPIVQVINYGVIYNYQYPVSVRPKKTHFLLYCSVFHGPSAPYHFLLVSQWKPFWQYNKTSLYYPLELHFDKYFECFGDKLHIY